MLDDEEDAAGLTRRLVREAAGARIIWDFDGVVGHTEPLHEASYQELASRRGYVFDDGFFDDLVGHTEQWIWERVIGQGFPAAVAEIPALHRERGDVVAHIALGSLEPSWLAADLMPALAPVASRQIVVSNGDPDLIAALLANWSLEPFVEVARRAPGRDKEALFRAHCVAPAVVLEDSDAYLRLGKELGAFTVGVRHSHNPRAALDADLVTHL
ncbi:MAG: HAD-superfamily hydrolase, subfamily variant 3 [Micrococcaceae bacterium]|jgi:beta-phosphoglucomutase-like phosphatase (HAD superfamily)|nr:HAD-superfamily hydrolase, subfamily variant 3 [Micrococcaceae bacterium]